MPSFKKVGKNKMPSFGGLALIQIQLLQACLGKTSMADCNHHAFLDDFPVDKDEFANFNCDLLLAHSHFALKPWQDRFFFFLSVKLRDDYFLDDSNLGVSTVSSFCLEKVNMEPENTPLGKGETSSKPPLFGFHVSFRGCTVFCQKGVGDVCQRIWSYQDLGSEHYKRFTTVPRLHCVVLELL